MDILIYNPADIDSVIGAAMFVKHKYHDARKLVKCYPASNKIPMDGSSYIWVGVIPSLQTLKLFNTVPETQHIGYFADDSCLNKKIMKHFSHCVCSTDFPGTKENEDGPIVPASCYYAVYTHLEANYGWYMSMMIGQFKSGEALTKNELGFIYKTYSDANMFLTGGINKFFIGDYGEIPEQRDNDNWDALMKNLKSLIPSIFYTSNIKIDNVFVKVPLINVNQNLSPWVIRLLSKVYEYVITYEQRQSKTVYTVYSKIAGFDIIALLQLNDNKDSGYLSHQL